MELSKKRGIQQIVIALAELGLKEAVICPGSRNAPLAISFNRHPAFHCISIRDERSAAFFAMGMSIELNRPVAIVCTSGSAALNFAPAISEAYYQKIPLIVITADRPKEWTNQGDGQTINQSGLYKNFILSSFDLKGDAEIKSDLWFNQRCVCEGWNKATMADRGPVHFNIPMHEPLYQTAGEIADNPRVFTGIELEKKLSANALQQLHREFNASKKVMILAGQCLPDLALQNEIARMAEMENVIVLTESTSNIHAPHFVENIDRCITTLNQKDSIELAPDLLITVGGAIISKRIKNILRIYRPKFHWNINEFNSYSDTYQSLTRLIPLNVVDFFKQFNKDIKAPSSDYREKWINKSKEIFSIHQKFFKECVFSDLYVFHKIYKELPNNIHVHIANSSPIRYAQLFNNTYIASCWSNRGTSGIDGCTSTAMGAARASPEKNFLLITGDVAFYYDINGLWNDASILNLKIIVINNGGGGIFRIISGPEKVDEMERFFETSMQSEAKKIAEHFHWNYLSAKDPETLEISLKKFFALDTQRCILEVFTGAEKSPEVLEKYWKFLKENSHHE